VDGTAFNLGVALGLLALLIVSLEVGFRRGRRAVLERDVTSSAQLGAVQGAVLGMLGLLLAFSFAAAGGRFLERQDLIVAEANAISTAWLRADLIGEPARSELRSALQAYTAHRVATSAHFRGRLSEADVAEIERLHERIWKSAVAGLEARPHAIVALLNPVNEVIDLHSARVYSAQKHLPLLVLALLVASSALALGVIGYGSGVANRRSLAMTVPLAAVIAVALWVTIDLDYARRGMLQLSDAPLQGLRFDGQSAAR